MVTLQDLAEAIHGAYQGAKKPEDRWPAAAKAALECLNARPKVAAILDVSDTGEIIEHVPPKEVE